MKLFIKTETNLLNPHYVIVAVNNIPGDRTGPQVVHTHEGGANGDPTPETKYLMSKKFFSSFFILKNYRKRSGRRQASMRGSRNCGSTLDQVPLMEVSSWRK